MGKFAAHFHRVRAVNLGENILHGVGPLVKAVEGTNPVAPDRGTAGKRTYGVETNLRKTERSVGIAGQIFIDPACRIHPHFIKQGRAEGVIP